MLYIIPLPLCCFVRVVLQRCLVGWYAIIELVPHNIMFDYEYSDITITILLISRRNMNVPRMTISNHLARDQLSREYTLGLTERTCRIDLIS